jgi:hypothetical protein
MRLLLDSLRRAVGNCFLPRVLLLSLLPLLIAGAAELVWTRLFWEENVRGAREILTAIPGMAQAIGWVAEHVSEAFPSVVYAIVIIFLATPVFVAIALVLGALWMTPAAAALVSRRRFPGLERRHGGSWIAGFARSMWHTLVALALSLVTLPLWIIPPLAIVLPTLIWGRATTRIMAYDGLAEHATPQEREAIVRAHAWPLLMIGMATGLLSSTPTLLWVISVPAAILFPIVMVGVTWIYTMIFAFSALWFTHYLLAALAALRAAEAATLSVQPGPPTPPGALPLVEEVPADDRFPGPPPDGEDSFNAL